VNRESACREHLRANLFREEKLGKIGRGDNRSARRVVPITHAAPKLMVPGKANHQLGFASHSELEIDLSPERTRLIRRDPN